MADEPRTDEPKTDEPKKDDPPKADPPKDPPKSFSQEDVDRIVQERLARDRKDRPSDEDLAAWKQASEKLTEIEEANKSDLEKAQAAKDKAEEKAQKAVERANKTLIRSAVIAEAAKQGAVDPDAVLALLPVNAVTLDNDDQVTGAEKAVKDLLDDKKYLVGEPTPPGPGDGGPRTPVPPKDLDAQITEAESKGDIRESIRLKNQKLLAAREQQAG